jgi:hypothetical protein
MTLKRTGSGRQACAGCPWWLENEIEADDGAVRLPLMQCGDEARPADGVSWPPAPPAAIVLPMPRPLALHVSALNDEEYTLFTDSFRDLLADDTPSAGIQYDAQSVSLREARAWLRGRYADIPLAALDEVGVKACLGSE